MMGDYNSVGDLYWDIVQTKVPPSVQGLPPFRHMLIELDLIDIYSAVNILLIGNIPVILAPITLYPT